MFALAVFEKFIIEPVAVDVDDVNNKIHEFIVELDVAFEVLAISIKLLTLADVEFCIREEPNKLHLEEPIAFIKFSIVFARVGLLVICDPIIERLALIKLIATVSLFAYNTDEFFIVISHNRPPPVELALKQLKPDGGAHTIFDNTTELV